MKEEKNELTEAKKILDLDGKLYEEICKLKVLDEFLDSIITKAEGGEESLEKLEGAQLIVEDVAKNLMSYRQEFLGC